MIQNTNYGASKSYVDAALSNTYTKAEIDTAVVHKAGSETIDGAKTFTSTTVFQHDDNNIVLSNPNYTAGTNPSSNKYNGILFKGSTAASQGWISHVAQADGATRFQLRSYNMSGANFKQMELFCMADGTGYASVPTPTSTAPTDAITTISYVSQTGNSAPNNLMHRSGDETVDGLKTYAHAINGTARQFVSQITSSASDAGKYRLICKMNRADLTGIRNHYLFYVFTRSRDRLPDMLYIYTSNNALNGFSIIRNNTENYTYVLSYDANFVYLYIITSASAADAVQVVLLFSSEGNPLLTMNTADLGDYNTITGTEYKRLTP